MGNTWYSIEVNEPHFFISQDGEALYALNHLVRRIVENPNDGLGLLRPSLGATGFFLIDINGFQKKSENIQR